MRWLIALVACAVLSTGCLSYVSYGYTWGAPRDDDPVAETAGILLGIELGVGLLIGLGMIARDDNRAKEWSTDLFVGLATPLVIDAAIALGVGASDFVGGARAPE